MLPCEEELRAPVSEGNDLDIPQCWPVPFRTCARLLKPRDPSRWPPRVARSWTGLLRVASAAVAGFKPFDFPLSVLSVP